jgi:hypothetical protein
LRASNFDVELFLKIFQKIQHYLQEEVVNKFKIKKTLFT